MKKKVLLSLSAVALIVVVSVGATLALLNDTTEEVTNTFTSNKKISISLREPKWDGYGFEEGTMPTELFFDGKVPEAVNDDNYPKGKEIATNYMADNTTGFGIKLAQEYMYGDTINKNPIVKNTSVDEDVYVAVSVQCKVGEEVISLTDFETKYGDLTFNDTWTSFGTKGNENFYYYGKDGNATVLEETAVTAEALFDSVEIKGREIKDATTLPPMQLVMKAYAVQAKGVSVSDAVTELKSFAGIE